MSKVIQKKAKETIAKNGKGQFEPAACKATAENTPLGRSKRGHFDIFEDF